MLIPAIALSISTLLLGYFHWQIPYSESSIESLILPWLTISLVLGAVFSDRSLPNGLLRGVAVAFGGPLAVMLRVIIDVIADPTSHNLWPFEIIIAGILTGPSSLLGAVLGWLPRRRPTAGAAN